MCARPPDALDLRFGLDCMNATIRGRCLGFKSIDGEVTTTLAERMLALRSDSRASIICIVLQKSVVLEVIVKIGMYRILSCRAPSLRLTVIAMAARRA